MKSGPDVFLRNDGPTLGATKGRNLYSIHSIQKKQPWFFRAEFPLKPTVYLVQEPLSSGAKPGDRLIYWGDADWTLQRKIPQPSNEDMGYLKPLRPRNPQHEHNVATLLQRLLWRPLLRAKKPVKEPPTLR